MSMPNGFAIGFLKAAVFWPLPLKQVFFFLRVCVCVLSPSATAYFSLLSVTALCSENTIKFV